MSPSKYAEPHEEDGAGWGGLVPTREELQAERRAGLMALAEEVAEAAAAFDTYYDFRTPCCEHCRPENPRDMDAARERLADALDNYRYAKSTAAPAPRSGAPR